MNFKTVSIDIVISHILEDVVGVEPHVDLEILVECAEVSEDTGQVPDLVLLHRLELLDPVHERGDLSGFWEEKMFVLFHRIFLKI